MQCCQATLPRADSILETHVAAKLSRGGLQVAKCPLCGPMVSGYSISKAGIVSVEQQLQSAPVQSVLEANISAEHHVQEGGVPTQYG